MVLITIVNGVYKPTYYWGAPHCMYCKNSKTQKTEEIVKTKDIFQFHSCLKTKKIMFYLQDSPLVSKKMPSCSTSVFYVQDVDYNLLIGSHEIAAPHLFTGLEKPAVDTCWFMYE